MASSTKKPAAPKQDDPTQSKCFIDTAREIEADESPNAMDLAFKAVVPTSSPKK